MAHRAGHGHGDIGSGAADGPTEPGARRRRLAREADGVLLGAGRRYQGNVAARPRPDAMPSGGWCCTVRLRTCASSWTVPCPAGLHRLADGARVHRAGRDVRLRLGLALCVRDFLRCRDGGGCGGGDSRTTGRGSGAVIATHFEVTGTRGVGLFPLWGPPQRVCAVDYTIGRHNQPTEMAFSDGVAGYVLQGHVPPGAPLTESASEGLDSAGHAVSPRALPGPADLRPGLQVVDPGSASRRLPSA